MEDIQFRLSLLHYMGLPPQIFRFVNRRGQCHFLTPWEFSFLAERSRVADMTLALQSILQQQTDQGRFQAQVFLHVQLKGQKFNMSGEGLSLTN